MRVSHETICAYVDSAEGQSEKLARHLPGRLKKRQPRSARHPRGQVFLPEVDPSTHRRDVFDYSEMFYNPKRKHTSNGMLSLVDLEIRQQKLNTAGV